MTKYFLGSDDDGHWFIVEADKRMEWEKWLEDVYSIDDFDTTPPEYAQEVGGSPGVVEFENPTISWDR